MSAEPLIKILVQWTSLHEVPRSPADITLDLRGVPHSVVVRLTRGPLCELLYGHLIRQEMVKSVVGVIRHKLLPTVRLLLFHQRGLSCKFLDSLQFLPWTLGADLF